MTMLSFNQVANLIKAIGTKRTILIQGENGIGVWLCPFCAMLIN